MTPLLPGSSTAGLRPATLGVLGGGQLGRMFVHVAQSMGYRAVVLDPDPHSPAGAVADEHLSAGFDDETALERFAQACDAVTTEFENVPARSLQWLAQRLPVAPSAEAVAVCQHRALEKEHFQRCGVPCAPHARIESEADIAAVPDALLPGILKTAALGYDGKGQVPVADRQALAQAWAQLHQVPCVLEQRLKLSCEISVVLARSKDGAMVNLPVQRNLHRDGILAVTQAPAAGVSQALCDQACASAQALAQALQYVGVLCVEFFVLEDGRLLANEMAPRPHNSAHHSLQSCDVSQFELQVRTLAGLPLPTPRQHSAAVMLNLLGDLWWHGRDADPRKTASVPLSPPWERVLALPGAHLHLYGKREPRPGRKMGHLTVTAPTAEAARAAALEAAKCLGMPPF